MKKFISCVAAATIVLSVISCREAEEMAELSVKQNSTAKLKNNSVRYNATTDDIAIVEIDKKKDPPVKDGDDW